MQVHTRSLSAGQSLTITPAMYVLQMSVMVNPSSTGTVTGDLTIDGVASAAISLTEGQGFSISSPIPNNVITGVVIACVSGTMDIMLAVQ